MATITASGANPRKLAATPPSSLAAGPGAGLVGPHPQREPGECRDGERHGQRQQGLRHIAPRHVDAVGDQHRRHVHRRRDHAGGRHHGDEGGDGGVVVAEAAQRRHGKNSGREHRYAGEADEHADHEQRQSGERQYRQNPAADGADKARRRGVGAAACAHHVAKKRAREQRQYEVDKSEAALDQMPERNAEVAQERRRHGDDQERQRQRPAQRDVQCQKQRDRERKDDPRMQPQFHASSL
jgi:hypothetical protein